MAVDFENSAPQPVVLAPGTEEADLSTTIATGGTAQVLAAANPARTKLVIYNNDATEDLWVAFLGRTAGVRTTGSMRVPADSPLSFSGDAPLSAVSVYAATTGHKITAWEG